MSSDGANSAGMMASGSVCATLQTLLDTGAAALQDASDSPRLDAQLLLCRAAGVNKMDILRAPERPAPPSAVQGFHALIARRRAGEPIAYLLGEREFWSMSLRITPATLIPRPETEMLVELALARIPPDQNSKVLDLGTGSGAIALAIARERPHAQVWATDASADALSVAQHNAQALGISNVRFCHGDWYTPLAAERFDIIVSNPPYIAEGDPHLQRGDLRFEPPQALTCGRDGMAALRHIAQQARAHLLSGGWLLMEHGYDQSAALLELMQALQFEDVADHPDLAGIPRVVHGRTT